VIYTRTAGMPCQDVHVLWHIQSPNTPLSMRRFAWAGMTATMGAMAGPAILGQLTSGSAFVSPLVTVASDVHPDRSAVLPATATASLHPIRVAGSISPNTWTGTLAFVAFVAAGMRARVCNRSASRSKAVVTQTSARVVMRANQDCAEFAEKLSENPESNQSLADKKPEEMVMFALAATAAVACIAAPVLAAVPAPELQTALQPDFTDQAVEAAAAAAEAAQESADKNKDWLDPWIDFNAGIIAGLDDVAEDKLHLPNTFGFAILFYTGLIKAITFPLNQSSLRTNAMMQLLAPKVKQMQKRYADDEETRNRMMLRLYDDCGVNPLGGCLPTLAQFPIFIGLYRAINRLAENNVHCKDPFLWIPSLSGPVEPGKPSLDWLLKSQYTDHFEPLIGWQSAGQYCVLPVLLVISQFVTTKISNPQGSQAQGPAGAITNLFPLIIGYTSLVSPSGLGIYWLFNNILTQGQTALIRNGLKQEFPEYKDLIDGKEKEAEKKPAEAAVEEKEIPRGFGVQEEDEDEDEDEEEEEESKLVQTNYTPSTRSSGTIRERRQARRAKRRRGR